MTSSQTLSSHLSLRSYQTEIASHSHDFAQLVLPISGALELQTGCHTGIVSTNTAAFIAPYEEHCFAASKENLFLVVDIKTPSLRSHATRMSSFLRVTPTTKKFLSFAQSYLMHEEHDAFCDYLVENLLFKLLGQTVASIEDHYVSKAKSWIEKHLAMPIDINKLSQVCHLSSSQLQRRFKRSTGQSLAEYWRHKRMLKAQQLLVSEHLSIETVAYEIGYENLPAFSRRFSQTFGMTPSQWREMMLTAKTMRAQNNTLTLLTC